MTTLPGNPHFTEGLLDSPDDRSTPSMLAAVAYEQRTANLMTACLSSNSRVLLHLNEKELHDLRLELRARLGLGPVEQELPF